jgi:hypothetical protein
MRITKKDLVIFSVTLLFCFILSFIALKQPIGDFGNHYYGSRVWADKGSAGVLYNDIHQFNEEIRTYGEKNYFENYIPVPPFSLLFYYPFTFFKAATAKIVFNILSILLFSLSFTRFARRSDFAYKWLFSLVIVCLPLYNNLVQGQSYLMVVAALMEIYISFEQRKFVITGLLIALIFHLKLFPALILLYFVINKEYRVVAWSLAWTVFIFLATLFAVGVETMKMYWTEIVPRFFDNEIVDPYYYGHQGFDIFLKNLFTFDAIRNPTPVFNSPFLEALTASVFVGIVLYIVMCMVKKNPGIKGYGILLFAMILSGNYVTNYSLILLLPFIMVMIEQKNFLIIGSILMIVCNLPLSFLSDAPLLIRYERILLLMLVFINLVFLEKPRMKLSHIFFVLLMFGALAVVRYENVSPGYLLGEKKDGIYFNIEIKENNILLSRCLGEKDEIDTVKFPEPVKEAVIIKKHPLLNNNKCRARCVYSINNKWLLYLSDDKQGIGMFQPRLIQPR